MQNLSKILKVIIQLKEVIAVVAVIAMYVLALFITVKSIPYNERLNSAEFEIKANGDDIDENKQSADKLEERDLKIIKSLGRIEGALGIEQ